ncbi:hypothetical protein B0T16DRAFT_193315 [Cercophora newfieldiana]|uniref:C2H2-type domain-containing protein n=1 Tax=Cercophora newfieldiana TaxID=92897 RepID=A0AA40CMM3_9PEZI|nr:hypothetical protein B0T16DRAFT_193315 [Cercophora newfieldiana]
MASPFSDIYPPLTMPDEQVEWVLVPVRVSGPSSLSSSPQIPMDTSFPPYPTQPPTMWPSNDLPPSPIVDPLAAQLESNIALAMSLQASYPLACFDTDTNPSHPFSADLLPPLATGPFPSADDAWPAADPYYSSASSLGSPTTATSNTPCSTPSSPQTFLCSDPNCFEFFTRSADLKRHERKHRQNFRCELCGKAHTDRRALNRHLESKHEEYAIQQGIKSEKIRCRMCDYVSRADNVRRHEKSQHALNASGSVSR